MNCRILLIFFIVLFTSIVGYGVYWSSYDMERLPKGTLIAEETSQDKTYTVKAYTSDAGATTSYSVIAELSFNKVSKKSKIIYFQYKESDASIRWKDDSTVIINNVELHMPNEKYHYKHDKEKLKQ